MGEVRESSVHPLSVSILRKAFGEIAAEMSHLVLGFVFFFSWLQPKPAIHGLGPLPRETRHISRFEIYLGAEVAGSTSSGRDGRRGRDSCHLKRNGSVARAPVYGGLQRRRQKVLVGPPVDFRGSEENILFLKNVSLRKLHDKI